MMRRATRLLADYGFSPNHVYLLDLVPLIAMIWADGVNHDQEIAILQDYTIRHLADLARICDGEEVISIDEANDFIGFFTHQPPDPEFLRELQSLAIEWLQNHKTEAGNRRILDYCMDIAAICADDFPCGCSSRVVASEKALLTDLVLALGYSERPAPCPPS
jgi:hypothetical protein